MMWRLCDFKITVSWFIFRLYKNVTTVLKFDIKIKRFPSRELLSFLYTHTTYIQDFWGHLRFFHFHVKSIRIVVRRMKEHFLSNTFKRVVLVYNITKYNLNLTRVPEKRVLTDRQQNDPIRVPYFPFRRATATRPGFEQKSLKFGFSLL